MTKQDGKWILKRNHAYYYQIQLQLEVCKLLYCDFVVWTEKDFVVERIAADKQFFNSAIDTVQQFFVYGILPEIVGKWYTRKPVANSEGVVTIPICTSTIQQMSNRILSLMKVKTCQSFGATAMNQALVR